MDLTVTEHENEEDPSEIIQPHCDRNFVAHLIANPLLVVATQ